MKYTKNYQLNQWDAADRVLREDFNTDNRKVDTALAAVQAACPWSKLAEITTDTETTQIDMDLSAYDLTRYQQLNLYLSCGDGSNATQLQLRCNGLTEGYAIHHDNGNDPYTCDYLCLVDYLNKSDAPGYSKICLYPGRVIMGIGCGLLLFIIRAYANYPEGCSFAILFMNVCTPLIDRFTAPHPFGEVKKHG